MIKRIVLITICLINLTGNSQISISSKHKGSLKKLNDKTIKKLKKSKTIFILPDYFKKSDYVKVINDSWTVTPFEVIYIDEFSYNNYLKDNFSFVHLNILRDDYITASGPNVSSLFINLDLFMLNNELINKRLNKIKNLDKRKKKYKGIIGKNRINIARVFLNLDLQNMKLYREDSEFLEALYKTKITTNFRLGYLKNYLQKINKTLVENESYWMYGDRITNEIKNLKNEILYIPKYIGQEVSRYRDNLNSDEENIKEKFEEYPYQIKIARNKELNNLILNGEKIYYATFVRMNNETFFNIVNSNNGNILYKEHKVTSKSNLKKKQIKKLVKHIKKTM